MPIHTGKESDIKPFLKWAGGKTQLLPAIDAKLSLLLAHKKHIDYIEPFAGSGAVLFFVLRNYQKVVRRAVINDVNTRLTNCYNIIKEAPEALITQLAVLEQEYYQYSTAEDRNKLFLEKRGEFNHPVSDDPVRISALMIFLNKTCFNGLYRVNAKGFFNVPFGKYVKPTICNPGLLRANSAALQKVEIMNTDFTETAQYINKDAFFYLDPPYKPISATASFNAYAKEGFADKDQLRLKAFCDNIHAGKAFFVQSNSDTSNKDSSNSFFQDLYKDYTVEKVRAKRAINSKGSERGEIYELLISNDKVLTKRKNRPLVILKTSL